MMSHSHDVKSKVYKVCSFPLGSSPPSTSEEETSQE